MEHARFLACLAADEARLRAVAPSAPARPVPTCPGWTVADLTRHVGTVYLHKTVAMREGTEPAVWPPAELATEDPVALLDRAYAGLLAEFARRAPSDPTATWYQPDQTVGFWMRRMAQETVIHRIDAELGTDQPVAPVPADLAVDGVDELLTAFLAYSVATWGDAFADILLAGANRPGRGGGRGWPRCRLLRRQHRRPARRPAALAVEPRPSWRAERGHGRGPGRRRRRAAAVHRQGDAVSVRRGEPR